MKQFPECMVEGDTHYNHIVTSTRLQRGDSQHGKKDRPIGS